MKLNVFIVVAIAICMTTCHSFMLRTETNAKRGGGSATQALEPMGGDLISRCQQQHLEMSMLEIGIHEEPDNGSQKNATTSSTVSEEKKEEEEKKKDPEVNDVDQKKSEKTEDGESKIDPDCPDKFKKSTSVAHAQIEGMDNATNFTVTPKRLKKLNDDEITEMIAKGKVLEKAMLNETKAKYFLNQAEDELLDRTKAAVICMESAHIATREGFEGWARNDSINSIDAMLKEAVNKTGWAQEKVDQIIPIRKLINQRKAIYKIAVEIRTSYENQFRALDKRRFQVAEDMCKKLTAEEKLNVRTVILRLSKIANDTKAVRDAVANPQPDQDLDDMIQAIVLGNRAAAQRKMLLQSVRKQKVHVCERDTQLKIERGIGNNSTDPEVFTTVSHKVIYKNLDLLRKKAELASQAAMEMRKKAGLYKLLLK